MSNNQSISDDPGTILDSLPISSGKVADARKAFAGPPVPASIKSMPGPRADEVLYRSPYRSTAPRITICDDGTLDEGEVVYVRSERIVIGRSKGDLLIPHDVAMSASHAEVARVDVGGKHAWVLRDLGSSNGTLARCRSVTLRPGMTLLIGTKRYRFEASPSPASLSRDDDADHKTATFDDLNKARADAPPALVESSLTGDKTPRRYPLESQRVAIGRPGFGNDVGLDDMCVAKVHAIISRDKKGVWQLESQPSLNGVWVKIDAVRLTDGCLFQCGEQRFRFHD